jgi:hypothetical protein
MIMAAGVLTALVTCDLPVSAADQPAMSMATVIYSDGSIMYRAQSNATHSRTAEPPQHAAANASRNCGAALATYVYEGAMYFSRSNLVVSAQGGRP